MTLGRALVSNLRSWNESAATLVDVAMGRKMADTVIRNARWVNVHSGEIIPKTDVAISEGRFAYVGPDASHAIGPDTMTIDADDRYMLPGLCDAHMHVESGMVTVTEFTRAVLPHGTTSMFIDPHEIGNVLGLDGVKLMHDEARGCRPMSMCRCPAVCLLLRVLRMLAPSWVSKMFKRLCSGPTLSAWERS